MIAPRVITASAPTRIDLAGGWTDVAPYTTDVGGAVCNIAIELRAVATVSADATGNGVPADDTLPRAAWERAGRPLVSVSLSSAVPVGSGLGGSSAAGVALAAALAEWRAEPMTPHELAELSRSTECDTMGLAGGCQDHFAAAFGGALLLRCGEETIVEQLPLSDATIDQFERRAMIAYTGESRISASTINAVLDAYRDSDAGTCLALRQMASLAPQIAKALSDGDINLVGALLAEQWQAQRALHPTISTPLIDRIVDDVAAAGALGTKALGASGGGSVLVVARDGFEESVRRALQAHAQLLPLTVARHGALVHVTEGRP